LAEPDWGDFKLVLALSRGGSVAGAARILGVDSSTVSRRLASMEQSLGACLVLRGGREFSFTPEGKAAVAAAESIEAIVAGAATSIRAAKTGIEGVVKLSVVPSMARTLMPFPAMVTDKHPGLSIEVNAAHRTVDLAKGEADIAIRMLQPREIDLVARRAFELGMAVYASKDYAARRGLPATYENLREHRLIQYAEDLLHLPHFSWLEAYASKGAPATRVDSTEMAASLTATGSGIGALSCFAGDTNPDLLRVFPDPIACIIGWIVYHETARNTARIRIVVDMLVEYFDAHKKALSGRHDA
jgi:DNA-binding transcriptional LysR family regulator